jgi:short-subunit dehydrogenase
MSSYFNGKIIWITGASSGIGEALALQWAQQNTRLILSARRIDELERVAAQCRKLGSECQIFQMDLANAQQIEQVADEVLRVYGYIDILVNNGGISQRSLVNETPVAVDRLIMEVDYFSGVVLTKKVLPSMLARKCGHIITISSITGLFGFRLRSAYAAAKHAIHGFYEALWAELNDEGINVTIVCPGRVHTNISLHALTKEGKEHGIMDHGQNGGVTAEYCARQILKAAERKKVTVYVGRKELLMVYFKRYIPWLFYKLVKKVQPT